MHCTHAVNHCGMSASDPFASGDRIVIHGLQARGDLNGYSGVLLGFDGATQRWEVQMETTAGERIRVKPANMRAAGQTVAEQREELVESVRAMKKVGVVFGRSACDLPADANPAEFEQRMQVFEQALCIVWPIHSACACVAVANILLTVNVIPTDIVVRWYITRCWL